MRLHWDGFAGDGYYTLLAVKRSKTRFTIRCWVQRFQREWFVTLRCMSKDDMLFDFSLRRFTSAKTAQHGAESMLQSAMDLYSLEVA